MTRVSTTISADASAYIREAAKTNAALQQIVGSLEKIATLNNRVSTETQKANQEQESSLNRISRSVDSWAAGLVGVGVAQRVITAELRNQLEIQTKMAAAQNTVAAAEQRLAMNARNPQELEQLRALGQRVATSTGVPLQAALDAAGSANSARGSAPWSAVESAAMTAARAQPNNVSEIPGIASALLDARLVTKSDNAKENYGKLAALQAVSRPVSLGTTARYLLPSAVGAQSILGAQDQYEWLASAAMMTGASADPSGEKTGGASQVIAGKMKAFFDNPGAFEKPGGGEDKGAKLLNAFILNQATGGMRPEAGRARRFLQNEPYWHNLFMSDAKLGVRAIPGAEALFRSENEGLIQENIKTMRAATEASGEAQLAGMESTPANRSARVSRLASSAAEFAALGNPMQAQLGSIRNSINEIEQGLGYSATGRWLADRGVDVAGLIGPGQQISELRGRMDYARENARRQNGTGSDLEKQIQRLINSLDGMAARIYQGNRGPARVGPPEIK